MIIGYVVILNIVSVMWVHASSETSFKQVDNKYIYTYEVQEKEEASFLSSLEKEKTIDNKKATLIDTQKTGGSTSLSTIRTVDKSFISDTNNTADIISKIESSVDYSENGYKGTLNLEEGLTIQNSYTTYSLSSLSGDSDGRKWAGRIPDFKAKIVRIVDRQLKISENCLFFCINIDTIMKP